MTRSYYRLVVFVAVNGNWIEIVYGTASGAVCVIVQHPETLGQGPQLFQSFHVHRTPITRVMLSEKYLISGTLYYMAIYVIILFILKAYFILFEMVCLMCPKFLYALSSVA